MIFRESNMVMFIKPDECIDCGACQPVCPNNAVYAGGEEYEFEGKTFPALSEHFYIVPEKCTECIGAHDTPQCVEVCPVNCVIVDPEKPKESKEELMEKYKKLHG
jgi:NAD-dependent dihydropyrimidine dehydrogenase PreA subunit